MPLSLVLLLALAQTSAGDPAAGAPRPPWRAFGVDSEWTLTIADGRMTLDRPGQPPVSAPAVEPKLGEGGWTWTARGLTVESMPLGCKASKGGDRYPDFVSVTVGRQSYMGCGGAKLAADDLLGTNWEIAEIGGGRVGGANYMVDFAGGRFLAYDGCHRVDGTYRQADGKLSLKPEAGTVGGCGPVSGPCSALFWRILAEPVGMAFADPAHIILTGKAGVIRLKAPDEDHLFDPPPPTPCGPPAK